MKFFQPGIVAMSILLTGCSGLPEGRWQETSPAAGTPAMVLDIDDDRISAYAGCNRMIGMAKMSGDQLLVERLTSTLMLCHGVEGEKEEELKQLLTNKPTVEVSGDQLILGVGNETYRFTRQPDMEDGLTRLIYVASEKVPCTGVAPTECLQIRESEDAPWTTYFGTIDGFEFEPGNIYHLRIKEFDVEKPAADVSSKRWILDNVLSVENLNVDTESASANVNAENPENEVESPKKEAENPASGDAK